MSIHTELEDWLQWKRGCSIERCRGDSADRLAAFGRKRLRTELERAGCHDLSLDYAGDETPTWAAWLAIEGFLLTHKDDGDRDGRSCKVYKTIFLGERAETTAAFEGGLTLLIRQNVVPAIAHGEDSQPRGKSGKPRRNVTRISIDTEDGAADWLPSEWADPASEADRLAIEQLAVKKAEELVASLTSDQKVVLLCKLLGKPLDAAIGADLVSCGKSQLSVRYKEIIARLQQLDWGFVVDQQEDYALSCALIQALLEWANGPENTVVRTSILEMRADT